MNYYEHHIGDYAEATAHLSFLEDAAYSRLIRKYYASEKSLPADLKAVQRLVGARTKEEREAVSTVLEEFFYLQEDGWHNYRCDKEISRYKEGDAEREQKCAHEKERMRRHREERSQLFAELRGLGITPKWDTPVTQLREMLKRARNVSSTRTAIEQEHTCNAPATRTGTEQERTRNAPATANQTPDTNTTNTPTNVVVLVKSEQPPPETRTAEQARIGLLCQQLRQLGIDATPQMPSWTELIPRYSDEQIIACAESTRHTKPDQRIHLNYLVPKLADVVLPKARMKANTRQPSSENFERIDYGTGGKL